MKKQAQVHANNYDSARAVLHTLVSLVQPIDRDEIERHLPADTALTTCGPESLVYALRCMGLTAQLIRTPYIMHLVPAAIMDNKVCLVLEGSHRPAAQQQWAILYNYEDGFVSSLGLSAHPRTYCLSTHIEPLLIIVD